MIREAKLPVVVGILEDRERIEIKGGDSVDHIMIRAHGTASGKIMLVDTLTGKVMFLDGREFASYLFDTLNRRSIGSVDTVERITLAACLLGSCPRGKPFVEEFSQRMKHYLPKLKEVTGMPYSFGIPYLTGRDASGKLEHIPIEGLDKGAMQVSFVDNEDHISKYLTSEMKTERFFLGKMKDRFFSTPTPDNVVSGTEIVGKPVEGGYVKNQTENVYRKPGSIMDFLRANIDVFHKPLFTKTLITER